MASFKNYPQARVGNKEHSQAAVVVVGAGISGKFETGMIGIHLQYVQELIYCRRSILGICMAIDLLKKNIHNFVVLEKSSGPGGTWRDNKYPGCCCDSEFRAKLYIIPGQMLTDWGPSLLPPLQFLVRAESELDEVIPWAGRNLGAWKFKDPFSATHYGLC